MNADSLLQALRFNGKNVWVTGAGQGIGYHVAQTFSHLGAKVTGIDKQFSAAQYCFATETADISNPSAVAKCCEKLLAENNRIDVLVNAAGILRLGAIEELTLDDWQATFAVNVSGAFYLTQQLIPTLRKQRAGVIVNLASNASRVPRKQMAAYCASKAAMVSFSHCLALELAPFDVRCNVVSPGSTDTPMLADMLGGEAGIKRTIEGSLENFKLGIPLGRIASPQQIANTVIFLASDLASHVTLQNLVVDGGATLSA